jgi:DNA polymerase-1
MDVILGSRLYEHEICQRGMQSPVYQMEMDVRAICSNMEWGGMRVDVPFAEQKAEELRREAASIADTIQTKYGFSPSSGPQLARWLLDRGVRLSVLTGGGAPSVSKDALEVARYSATGEAADVMDAVLRQRKITKMASTYFDNFVNMSTDGLLHPQIQTLQARTGRSSITQPAMQTLPRVSEDPDSRMVRQAIIPREKNHYLVSSDFSQIELRIIASLSGDEGLIQAFADADESGVDIFTASMRLVYGDPTLDKGDSRRGLIKNTFYGSAYGAGVAKMAQTANAGDIFKQTMVNLAHAGLEEYMVCPVHDEVVFSIPEEDVEEVSHVIGEVMPYNELRVAVPAVPSPGVKTWAEAK